MIKVKTHKGIKKGEIVKTNIKTIWVKLEDGNTIKRKKNEIVE